VVDFKTGGEFEANQAVYTAQLALWKATSLPTKAILFVL
jgi:hypothetical protein